MVSEYEAAAKEIEAMGSELLKRDDAGDYIEHSDARVARVSATSKTKNGTDISSAARVQIEEAPTRE